eukprot:GILK01003905.1.p1 GENE.GILK01003905.1~~GILK01003905.1.p1  ORF type:complete len:375 (+),score=27.41 GILK01003905.1:93-1127(+)
MEQPSVCLISLQHIPDNSLLSSLEQAGFGVLSLDSLIATSIDSFSLASSVDMLIVSCDYSRVNQVKKFLEQVGFRRKTLFRCVFSPEVAENALAITELFKHGCHMVSASVEDMVCTTKLICHRSRRGTFSCQYCGLDKLEEDELWTHNQVMHTNAPNIAADCPICRSRTRNYSVHLFENHGPVGRGEFPGENVASTCFSFALVVVRRPSDGKFLLIQEYCNQGWWLPGGKLDAGESFEEAAKRECKEEAGIDVVLKGVLRFEHTPQRDYNRMRVIFYAEPADATQLPKSIPDYESLGACWVSYTDLPQLPLRGPEPLLWAKYLENGGAICPMSSIAGERDDTVV